MNAKANHAGNDVCKNAKRPWSELEDRMIIENNFSDDELAEKLGRSKNAIYMRKFRVRRKGYKAFQEPLEKFNLP